MELRNSFTVPADIATAWSTLLDVEAIAPCMPGATLETVNGDEFTGNVKVKLGPVSMTYGGEARFLSKDDAAHTAVIEGNGKETRGTGTARAIVTCTLSQESPHETRVDVTTDLTITGKAAQFGRGVMQDVAGRLVTQFAGNLGTVIASRAATDTTTEAMPAPAQQAEALDLGSVAAAPVLKRVLPVVIGLVVIIGLIWFIASR
ncbi:MAG: carbon monoxide dehydrogenase [Actinobacteria bacterium]|nr:carbon monoxide dehydrogenase [Actinomycetota bacterium]